MHKNTTDFGFEQVERDQKQKRVRGVFDSVASKYDVMNDLMSLGIHRIWKRMAINYGQFRPNQTVLDLAGGTGDLSALIAPQIKPHGRLILSDINNAMLSLGIKRLQDEGWLNVETVQANAECLPFNDNTFDRIIMGFGLRNVTDKDKALQSMARVLKPGGRLIILEFSHPVNPLLSKAYDWYSFNILPKIGGWVAQDKDSYQYLAESIRMHPNQETLKGMCLNAGFDACEYFNLNGGIVAIHRGIKY